MKHNVYAISKFILFILLTFEAFSQKNDSTSATKQTATQQHSKNPFQQFIGEWTLENDDWIQNWGEKTEQIKIPHHHTVCRQLNTDNSLLAVIDGVPPYEGTVRENGDVFLKISFADEAPGTYRKYSYTWVSKNEYILKSVQYNANGQPTGLHYGGTFIRITGQK